MGTVAVASGVAVTRPILPRRSTRAAKPVSVQGTRRRTVDDRAPAPLRGSRDTGPPVPGALPALDRAPAVADPAARCRLRRDLDGRAGPRARRDRPRAADRCRRRRPVRGRPLVAGGAGAGRRAGRVRRAAAPGRGPQLAQRLVPGHAAARSAQRTRRRGDPSPAADRRDRLGGHQRRAAHRQRLRRHGAARRGHRLVRRRCGHPAARLGAARRHRAPRGARDGAAARPAAAAAPTAAGGAARRRREADGPRRRHRRRPAGAARHRRRARLPAPLPHPVRRAAAGRRARLRAAGDPRRRAGPAPGRLPRARHLAQRPPRARGHHRRGRRGGVLRLRVLPRDPDPDGGRGRRQDDPLDGRGQARRRGPGHRARGVQPGDSRTTSRRTGSRCTIPGRGCTSPPGRWSGS